MATSPVPVTVQQYLNLVTSEHNQKPKFMAMLGVELQPWVDMQNLLQTFSTVFDIAHAVGDQLDKIGQWVGQSRNLAIPLQGVYLTWNTSGLGWGQGTWFLPGDNTSQIDTLPDDSYRVLLAAVIAANHWDGTVPGAYAIWQDLFSLLGMNILIQDNQNMTMFFVLINTGVNAVALALLTNGYVALRPAGVQITGYFQPSVANAPVFAWNVNPNNSNCAGWGVGCWIEQITVP